MSNLSGRGSSSGSGSKSGNSCSYAVRLLVLGAAWLAGRERKVVCGSGRNSRGLYRVAYLTVLALIRETASKNGSCDS